jgi:molybdopterin-guanine dinucleotide biosynthesis protein A
MMMMDALVLAGGQMAAEDPLFSEGQDGFRSLIPIQQKPMAQWVMDALSESPAIAEIYVIGLSADYGLTSSKPIHWLEDHGGIFENIRAGVLQSAADHPDESHVMVASADIPAVRSEMVDWLAAQVEQHPDDTVLFYNVVTQDVMEARFPNAQRSFVRFRDVAVCGGDLNLVGKALFLDEKPIWKKLTSKRKTPMQQAALLGLDTLLLVLLHWVTLDAAVRRICKRLDLKACALRSPYAEMAMDADKPGQLAILRQDLEARL